MTITSSAGLTTASSVSVTVNQTLTLLSGITPGPVTLSTQSQEQFAATELDQFGNTVGTPAAVTWTAASGTITSSGLYTPPAVAGSDTDDGPNGSSTPRPA